VVDEPKPRYTPTYIPAAPGYYVLGEPESEDDADCLPRWPVIAWMLNTIIDEARSDGMPTEAYCRPLPVTLDFLSSPTGKDCHVLTPDGEVLASWGGWFSTADEFVTTFLARAKETPEERLARYRAAANAS
jgi:hypothetical protein